MQQNSLVERALLRLLEEPFGPYLDEEVLSARCKSTKTSVLQLQQVMFERDGQAVAVNENDDVRFRGILALSSINQLSPDGVDYIVSEIRHRFTEMRNAGTPLRHLRDNISVADLFRELDNWRKRRDVSNKKQDQDVPTVNVWVQGEKLMAVGYLTSESSPVFSDRSENEIRQASLVPNGLSLPSMDQGRQYQVCSLEIRTYSLSRTYLLRWHTYRTMDDIVKLDKNETPVEDRTPEWFVDQYLRNFAYVPRYRFRRLLYDHDASDTDSEDELLKDADGDIAMLSAADLGYGDVGKITRLPRHPRRVHKAEVFSLFASHVEWIIRQQEVRTRKWLDLASWRAWRGQVQNQRRAAQKYDVRWGICDEQVIDEELYDSDNEHARSVEIPPPPTAPHSASSGGRAGRGQGQDGRFFSLGGRDSDDEVVRVVTTNRATSARSGSAATSVQSGKPSSKPRKPMSTSAIVAKPPRGPGRPKKKKAKVTSPLSHLAAMDNELSQNIYDTDFSENSTTSASRSPSPSSLPCPIDPAIVSAIPVAFQHPPAIDSDLKWHCPVQHCDHVLDLMNLQQTNIRPLKRADIAFIHSQEWRIGEEKTVQMLYDMVSSHWEGHLREWGIKLTILQDGASSMIFEWEKPALHRPWPSLDWTHYIKQTQERQKEAEVKVEEDN